MGRLVREYYIGLGQAICDYLFTFQTTSFVVMEVVY